MSARIVTTLAVGLFVAGCGGATQSDFPELGVKQQALGTPVRVTTQNQNTAFPTANVILGRAGNSLVLIGGDPANGNELWRASLDGGAGSLLRDVNPGPGYEVNTFSSNPFVYTSFGNTGVFFADDGAHGRELWKTDGTPEGTQLVLDMSPGMVSTAPGANFASTDNAAFFEASAISGATQPSGLWVTDGTANGTRLVKPSGSGGGSFSSLTGAGNTMYFVSGGELWASDGTDAGTAPVLCAASTNKPYNLGSLYAWNGAVYFAATCDSSTGTELYRVRSLQAGAELVKDIGPSNGSNPVGYAAYNGALYFFADDGVHGRELWRTDGTAAGTLEVTDRDVFFPLTSGAVQMASASNGLYFSPGVDVTAPTNDLWFSDGTDAGTQYVGTIPSAIQELSAVGTQALFFADGPNSNPSPWVSDGTDAGTRLFSSQGQQLPAPFYVYGDHAFFELGGANAGIGYLMHTDGTTLDSVPGLSASISNFYILTLVPLHGGVLVPMANALWFTDGTDAGTYRLQPTSTFPFTQHIVTSGDNAYFSTYVPAGTQPYGGQVYRTDGTQAGTQQYGVLPPNAFGDVLGVLGDRVLLSMGLGGAGKGLYAVEPDAGAYLVAAIKPDGGSNPREATVFNGQLFFVADFADGYGSSAVYMTDGTESGTRQLAVLPYDMGVTYATELNGALYFLGPDRNLWKTDGTDAGTVLVYSNGQFASGPQWITRVNGTLYFSAGGTAGIELYKSDGTTNGTVLVKDLNPGPLSSNPSRLAEWNGRLVFLADDGTGQKMFISDGTESGTTVVTDMLTGYIPYNYPEYNERIFAVPGGPILFPGGDDHGDELWASYGTPQSTFRVQDIYAGAPSSTPATFTLVGDKAFFVANDGDGGQVWTIPVERDGGGFVGAGGGTGGGAGGGSGQGGGTGNGGGSGAGGGNGGAGGGGGSSSAKKGCGCSADPSFGLGALALLALAMRRRRQC